MPGAQKSCASKRHRDGDDGNGSLLKRQRCESAAAAALRVAFDNAVLTKDFESACDFVKSGVHFDESTLNRALDEAMTAKHYFAAVTFVQAGARLLFKPAQGVCLSYIFSEALFDKDYDSAEHALQAGASPNECWKIMWSNHLDSPNLEVRQVNITEKLLLMGIDPNMGLDPHLPSHARPLTIVLFLLESSMFREDQSRLSTIRLIKLLFQHGVRMFSSDDLKFAMKDTDDGDASMHLTQDFTVVGFLFQGRRGSLSLEFKVLFLQSMIYFFHSCYLTGRLDGDINRGLFLACQTMITGISLREPDSIRRRIPAIRDIMLPLCQDLEGDAFDAHGPDFEVTVGTYISFAEDIAQQYEEEAGESDDEEWEEEASDADMQDVESEEEEEDEFVDAASEEDESDAAEKEENFEGNFNN